jgi:hypothetical protein
VNTRRRKMAWAGERGSTLLVALIFAVCLAIVLASYAALSQVGLKTSTRNMHSVHSIELAEVGLEDALWAMNHNANNTFWSPNWNRSAGIATKSASLGNPGIVCTYPDGAIGYAYVTITNYDGSLNPTALSVQATGIVQPLDDYNINKRDVIMRAVQTTLTQAPLFTNAVAATNGGVQFNAGGTVDSYDSSIGPYLLGTNSSSSAIIASSTNAQIDGVTVNGYVASATSDPSYASNPITAQGHVSGSPYQSLFDPVPISPQMPANTPASGAVGLIGATTPLYADNLVLDPLSTLTVNGAVVISVAGNMDVEGQIVISPGSSLEILLKGDLALNGGGIDNQTHAPQSLSILSTAPSTSTPTYTIGSSTDFYGALYAPYANLSVGTQGTPSSVALYGSVVAKDIKFYATPQIHYDLNLRKVPPQGAPNPYQISGWKEIPFSSIPGAQLDSSAASYLPPLRTSP